MRIKKDRHVPLLACCYTLLQFRGADLRVHKLLPRKAPPIRPIFVATSEHSLPVLRILASYTPPRGGSAQVAEFIWHKDPFNSVYELDEVYHNSPLQVPFVPIGPLISAPRTPPPVFALIAPKKSEQPQKSRIPDFELCEVGYTCATMAESRTAQNFQPELELSVRKLVMGCLLHHASGCSFY